MIIAFTFFCAVAWAKRFESIFERTSTLVEACAVSGPSTGKTVNARSVTARMRVGRKCDLTLPHTRGYKVGYEVVI